MNNENTNLYPSCTCDASTREITQEKPVSNTYYIGGKKTTPAMKEQYSLENFFIYTVIILQHE